MTIQEAIKSGKPFKRPTFNLAGWYLGLDDEWTGFSFHPVGNVEVQIRLALEDILADDWVLKPDDLDSDAPVCGAV